MSAPPAPDGTQLTNDGAPSTNKSTPARKLHNTPATPTTSRSVKLSGSSGEDVFEPMEVLPASDSNPQITILKLNQERLLVDNIGSSIKTTIDSKNTKGRLYDVFKDNPLKPALVALDNTVKIAGAITIMNGNINKRFDHLEKLIVGLIESQNQLAVSQKQLVDSINQEKIDREKSQKQLEDKINQLADSQNQLAESIKKEKIDREAGLIQLRTSIFEKIESEKQKPTVSAKVEDDKVIITVLRQ